MAQKIETADAQEEATEADKDRIGTLENVLKEAEVVVGEPEDVVPPEVRRRQSRQDSSVIIRVNEDIEDMSYVAGGRRESYTFEAGKQYRVPRHIAVELENNGKIWH